ncbi:DNA-processing protein DprA [Robiginitalea sp. IMCC44478]|uniref:DNA-processing protein DprA n=1 Tax=Robiginitalea sp. IMCC44478 TaxID=3459122 RepID=UPI004041A6FF
MAEDELISLIRLQRIPGLGPVRARKLIRYFGSPSAIFSPGSESSFQKRKGGFQLRQKLSDTSYLRAAEAQYRKMTAMGVHCLAYWDENYPFYLTQCQDAPLLLFQKGNFALNKRPCISIVGTRSMTTYGRDFCNDFLPGIAHINPVIISGFAYGVDIYAQRLAVDLGLTTIACLAHGLDRIYPREHYKYVEDVVVRGGFFTEFWTGTRPERHHFLQRNRIIAGLSQVTVVVESAVSGGSLVTADLAFNYQREVFAVPGRVGDKKSEGCNRIIFENKAQLFYSTEKFLESMNWEGPGPDIKTGTLPDLSGLDTTEAQIMEFMAGNKEAFLDDIAFNVRLSIAETASRLLQMELKGLLRSLPGKRFETRN